MHRSFLVILVLIRRLNDFAHGILYQNFVNEYVLLVALL